MASRPKTALVLAGGAARGAYEAGVISYLYDGLERETGAKPQFDIFCGTSVGAINACFLAANAHRPADQGRLLADRWSSLELEDVLKIDVSDVGRFLRTLVGVGGRASPSRRSGLVDPSRLETLVLDTAPWSYIQKNLEDKRFDSLAVSATHVATGRTEVFVQRADGTVPPWSRDARVRAVSARIRPQHALASAAIPLLFPAVKIDGQYYCDGGLRQNTPLSPALRLGADRVLVIALRHEPRTVRESSDRISLLSPEREEAFPSPFFLLGKVLNALLLDHLDYDLQRLERYNALIEGGVAAFGGAFEERLNEVLSKYRGQTVRRVQPMLIRPSRDLGELAAHYARTEAFARRARGLAGTIVRRLADVETPDEADLVSYLLFDGGYCKMLVELGIADARALRTQLAEFFSHAA